MTLLSRASVSPY